MDQAVRRGGVDEPPAGSASGLAVVICALPGPAAVAGRRERPQDAPAVGVDRQRAPVGRRHEDAGCGSRRPPSRRAGRSARSRPSRAGSRWSAAGDRRSRLVISLESSLASVAAGRGRTRASRCSRPALAVLGAGIAARAGRRSGHLGRGELPQPATSAHAAAARPPRLIVCARIGRLLADRAPGRLPVCSGRVPERGELESRRFS